MRKLALLALLMLVMLPSMAAAQGLNLEELAAAR